MTYPSPRLRAAHSHVFRGRLGRLIELPQQLSPPQHLADGVRIERVEMNEVEPIVAGELEESVACVDIVAFLYEERRNAAGGLGNDFDAIAFTTGGPVDADGKGQHGGEETYVRKRSAIVSDDQRFKLVELGLG